MRRLKGSTQEKLHFSVRVWRVSIHIRKLMAPEVGFGGVFPVR
jgi:hypothetical protein